MATGGVSCPTRKIYEATFNFSDLSSQGGAVSTQAHGFGFEPSCAWIARTGGTQAAGSVIFTIQSYDDTNFTFTLFNSRTSGTAKGLFCTVYAIE